MAKNTKKSNAICFFLLFLFSAFRYDVGFDYMAYLHLLKSHSACDRFEYFERALQQFSSEHYIPLFFIVNSFITVYFIKWGLEKISPNVSISAVAFLCLPLLFTHSFSIIRFWSAVSILFFASTFLKDGKWRIFIVLWLISIGFHSSAIIGILFLPLYYFRISKITNIIILILSFVGGEFVLSHILGTVMPENIFTDKLTHYANAASTGNSMTKLPYVYLALDILAMTFWSKADTKEGVLRNKLITIFNIGVSFIFLFSFDTTLNSRLCRPFLVYIIVLIPIIFKCLSVRSRRIALPAFTVFSCAMFMYTITIYNEGINKSEYLPYRIILLENY